jgi:predicted ATPase/DNA-binding CsgD family transcriptional regulator
MSRLSCTTAGSGGGPLPRPSRPLTALLGRERDLAAVSRLLAENRLVTLTGPGGVGKTRLALAVAAATTREFADGTDLIELDAILDGALLPAALADSLGVAGAPGAGTGGHLVRVLRALRDQRRLLVLDNCEQVRAGCAALAAAVLGNCPGAAVLATSRSPLGVPGEVTWRVPSLAFPSPEHLPPLGDLGGFPAAALFVERARATRPGLSLGPGDCRRLDGIPLALELAAARAGSMTLPEIAARLTGCMDLLAADRAGPARQQTLRASVEWSFSLLPAAERVVFQRLAVFHGGWTLEAAEKVCAADEDVDERGDRPITPERVAGLLASLTDRSLVQAEQTADGSRYRFLEVTRAFAAERLAAAGEEDSTRKRHARYCAPASWAGSSQPTVSQRRASRPRAGRPGSVQPALSPLYLSQPGPGSLDAGGLPLTRRELQIAGLLTTGLTNRQIGARLFIAERTVDTHVGRILAKLGCATRTQVAAMVAGARAR